MVKFKIYIEGAGPSKFQGAEFRQAWRSFFKSAGLEGRLPTVVRGESRSSTYDRFVTACAINDPDYVPLLLVDSEGPIRDEQPTWEYLHQRKADRWLRPLGADTDSAFLMVQLMETWFLADREALNSFFGQHFKSKKIPNWANLEDVPKQDVVAKLEEATAECGSKRYAKGSLSFELLATIRATRVEELCPRAKALLNRLRNA